MNKSIPVKHSPQPDPIYYERMDESTLLELFSLYDRLGYTQMVDEVAQVIRRKAARGEISIFENSPTIIAPDVPILFTLFPFNLLWSQLRKQ